MRILIAGGRVLDPSQEWDQVGDVLVDNGRVVDMAPHLGARLPLAGLQVVNASGLWVLPGLIDMHVHLREPGREEDETLESGTRAAALGGVTTVLSMPNTVPPVDTPERVAWLVERARSTAKVRVEVAGAVTTGQLGEDLAPLEGMVNHGARAFTDDGKAVATGPLVRRALEQSKVLGVPLIEHCEDPTLSNGGCMNEGARSRALGLRGIPDASETVVALRDIELLRLTGGSLHIAHISCQATVELLRRAKEDGLLVTGEICPHHFTLCDADVPSADSNYKMNPPLRSSENVEAMRQALAKGVVEVIATDHAPHAAEKKARPFSEAPFGIIGLETLIPLSMELVRAGLISPLTWTSVLTTGPARILGLRDRASLKPGMPADITVVDPHLQRKMGRFGSKSQNSPFKDRILTGHAVMTMVNGHVVMEHGRLL
jgi:dihydroorotase